MSDVASPFDHEVSVANGGAFTEPDAAAMATALLSVPDPPGTGDASVDSILAEFVAQSASSDELSLHIEGATHAHRQLQARLSADREH